MMICDDMQRDAMLCNEKRNLDQVADDLVDILADETELGELGCCIVYRRFASYKRWHPTRAISY